MIDTKPANDSTEILRVGQTVVVGGWRVQRFMTSVRMTDITNAGKRGKRCAEFALYDHTGAGPWESLALEAVYSARVGRVPAFVAEASEIVSVETRSLRGVDVEPDAPAVNVRGMHVSVRASALEFVVEDARDIHNETTMMGTDRTGAKRFYAWARENAEALRGMSFSEVFSACRSLGIKTHTWCAVD